MTDAPHPPPGWHPPNPPTSPPPPPPTSPGGYPPPPPPASQPGWAAPSPPAPPAPGVGGPTLPPPPGTPGYGYGYTPVSGQARPLGGIATALTVLLWVTVPLSLFTAYALFNRVALIDDGSFTQQEADDANALVAGAIGLSFLVGIATVVMWFIWQFRHAKNAEALGKRDGLGAGWAIGGWFIPFANVVLGPLQLLQSARWSDADQPGRGRTPPALIAWWVLVAVSGIGRIRVAFSGGNLDESFDNDDVRAADQAGGVAQFLTIAAAVAAIVMVRQVTQRQRDALRQRGLAT